MKKIDKKTKMLGLIALIIIIVGWIIVLVKGFNFDLRYEQSKTIELYISKEFEISDIKKIIDEVMPNEEVIVQKVEVYGDSANIIAKEITEEQKNEIINKINEKYEIELTSDTIEIKSIPHVKIIDILKPYIVPCIIATILVVAYMCIRYYNLGVVKILVATLGISVLSQIILFSLIAITRIPVGKLTIAMSITVYILSLIGITTKFEKERAKLQEEE